MNFAPSITDYIATLNNPAGVFRTLGEPAIERDLYGELRFRAGNAAAIFRYGGDRFLKLYVRPNPYLREIYDYVARIQSPILPRVRLLRDELFVLSPGGTSGWVDVVEGEWVEGVTLDALLSEDADRRAICLMAFDELCAELRSAEWAHGDLKPENIVVRPDGKMTLIDCDAMWIPAFGKPSSDHIAGRPAVELGTPPWAAPERLASRSAKHSVPFDKSIDDHSVAAIRERLATL